MANLHELTKQLDVLTWNSRSVLNALIRSVMAAGSSNGFTVKRAGKDVSLTRSDIYHITQFYEAWEAKRYDTDPDVFYAVLDKVDAAYNGQVRVAVTKHAEIMWMDSTNVDKADPYNSSNQDYWIDKVANLENPKWFTNTAPIPLSIRTPIYDENFSTKTYDDYETYLFPSAYYAIDTFGHLGDGNTHSGGGKNWVLDIDEKFQVHADRALFDIHNENWENVMASAYDADTPKYGFEGGEDCYSLGKNNFTYGTNNQANGTDSAVVGGSLNTAVYGSVFGGKNNHTVGSLGVIAGGANNYVTASQGFATNMGNHVGGYSYKFERMYTAPSGGSETECEPPPPSTSNCRYILDNNDASNPSTGGLGIGSNQVYISKDTIDASGITENGCFVSYGKYVSSTSPFDFKVGDAVVLYCYYVDTSNVSKTCKPLSADVVSIDPRYDGNTLTGYVITLSKDISSANIDGLGASTVINGRISRTIVSDYPKLNGDNEYLDRDITLNSDNAGALGYNNIAAGTGQIVVGTSNVELLRPKFIVGTGSSYIYSDEGFERINSFVSARNYTYLKTPSSYIVSGVATVSTAELHGDYTGTALDDIRRYDEDYLVDNVKKYAGMYAYSYDSQMSEDTCAVLRVFHEKSVLAIGNNGLLLHEPDTGTVGLYTELYSDDGKVCIHAGGANEWLPFNNNMIGKSVSVYAEGDIGLHALNLKISVPYGYLMINGDTSKALTAQPMGTGVESFGKRTTMHALDYISDTGSYYVSKNDSGWYSNGTVLNTEIPSTFNSSGVNAFHVLASSKWKSGSNYDVAEIILPGDLSNGINKHNIQSNDLPHPMVCVYKTTKGDTPASASTSRNISGAGYVLEELAYRSDIVSSGGSSTVVSTTVATNKPFAAYCLPNSTYSGSYYRTDSNPDLMVTDDGKYYYRDPYLNSIDHNDNGPFYKTDTVKSPVYDNSFGGSIIHADRFGNIGGRGSVINSMNDVYTGYFYVNGVALNPNMYMYGRDASGNAIGISYLAYAPSSYFGKVSSNWYNDQLNVLPSTETMSNTRGLCTSKFSRGSFNYTNTTDKTILNDLCDVYMVSRIYQTNRLEWYRIIQGLHIVIANGILIVEGTLDLSHVNGTNPTMFMPTTSDESGNPKFDPTTYDKDDPDYLVRKTALEFNIPVDPSIFDKYRQVMNPYTYVTSTLQGGCVFTGTKIVYCSGVYQHDMYEASIVQGQIIHDYGFYGPHITLSFAAPDSNGRPDLSGLTSVKFHLEGAIEYV